MKDSINPKTEGLVINLRATNPIVDAVRSTPTQSKNIDVNKLFGERTSTHFTNTSILDTHEKLFDGTWVPKYENFDPTKSTQENAERLAQSQSKGDKWANGWTKFFGKVGSSFAGGTVGSVRGLGEFMSTGSIEAIYDNDFSKRLSDFDTKLTYNNPNHKTQEEKDMNFLQAMTTANWWADDFLGGLSFTVGTVLSEGAWALATGGSSLAVTGAKFGSNLAGRTMLKKGIKSLVKPTFKKTLTLGDDLAEAAVNTSIGANVRGGLLGGRVGEALNTARFTMTSAGWESTFESLSYLKEGLQSFDSNFYADNGRMPTPEERQDYINRLYDGANTVFGGNMILVGSSNLAIIGKWFNIGKPSFVSSLDKSLKRKLFGIGLDKTGKSVIEATRAQRIAGGLYSWLKPAVTEGVWEEGGQSVLSKAISEYVYAPFNPEYNNTSISMVEAFAEGFDETFTTKDGWKEVWTGMLIGIVGDKGGNMISGRGLKSGVTQMREEVKKMAEFNKSYSIDNLTESLFYANRVQNSNKELDINSPEVLALKRREASLGQLTQAYNTGMYEDIVDDTITGLSLIDSNTMADELGVSVEEVNTMKEEAIESYKSLAKEYKRNRDFVEYYFGENIKGEKPIQSRLKKDAIAFIMTNGQESYNESREVLNQLRDRLIATIPGIDVNSILNVSDILAHATDQNKESFAKLTNELDSVMAEINSLTNEIANLSTKERPGIVDSNLIADEANILTEKLNELNTKKQTIEAEANRILSASALSNPYYKEQDGVQYISAEDIVKLDDSLKDLESRLQDSFEGIESKESLTELLYAYKDHLRAFKEYAEVSRGIVSGKLDLSSKKSLIGKILGDKKYSEEEKRFLKTVSERVSVNVMDYLANVMGINNAVKDAEKVVETPTEQAEENKQTKTALQRIIDNNTFLREKYGEDALQALISQQVVEEFENLMLKANGDKSFNGKYENISTNTSLTAEEKGRLKELMEMYGTLAIGEGFSEQGVTLMDVLTQINQNKIVPTSEKETLTVSDFSELMTDESEDADGVRNEEVTQTPMNVQVSKRGSTLVVHNLTLKGLLGKLGVAVADNRTTNRTNRGVSVEELSNDKGTRIRFELGGSVLNAFVNNRGAVELTSENRGDNVLSIISNNSNLTSVKYAYGTNTKYSFLFEDGKPMLSDFQVTPRFSEQAIYDLAGGEYVRFEVDINDPYNQSIQDLPFEEKVKLVKVFIVDSAGNVVGELKALENTYGIANFNILREQAATVLDNGGGFVGYEAQVKTVLLGTPNVELGADGTPTAVDTSYESVVDWGYMQDGKMTLKNKTETSNIRKDFVKRVKNKGRIPVVVIRFGSQTIAVPVALKGTPSNEGSKHKKALEESNDNTAKKVIDLNADLIARGSSQRFYFNSPTDQNVYNQDGSLSSEVLDAVEFLDNYEVTPDISTMGKDAAMSSVNSPVNFDNKPFISPKIILNFDKMYKIGERTPEVTEAKEATEKASKEAVKVVEKVKSLDENNLKYKDTQFTEATLLNHVKSGTIFMYQGMEGTLDTDGQRLIFTSGNQEFDLGYAPNLTLLELKNLGLERAEAMSVEITQDGNIVFNGETYTQDPSVQTVIVDGQDRYVTLKSSNGLYVTFQGDKADAIAYEMAKQEFTNKDITDEQGKEIVKQAREATVTKRTRKIAPKAEDTDSKSSVIVTTTKKEAQEVVEELKPLDGTLEEVSVPSEGSANTEQQIVEIERGRKDSSAYAEIAALENTKPVSVKKSRKTKKTAPKGVGDVAKGITVTHKGKNKKVKSVTKNADGTVKRIELEDGTRLGKPVNPTQQEISPVSTIIDRLKKNGLASAVYEVTTEQLNEELANRANTPVRNQLPLMEVQDLGEVIGTGTETVVRRKGDKVYKVYDVASSKMYSDESEFITSMEAQAQAFPEMGTMIVGKTEKGEYVVEQNYVTGATPTKEQLTEYMQSKGFVYSDGTWKRDGFEFDDVTPHNAFIKKDGTVVVYDANVYRGEATLPNWVRAQVSAFHGSPHTFDRFSTDNIGTGEGAQAFGWGLYFTDLEGIARGYAEALSKNSFTVDGAEVVADLTDNSLYFQTVFEIAENGFNLTKERALSGEYFSKTVGEKILENLDLLEGKEVRRVPNRNLYKVSLHKGKQPSEYTWLEWDKRLSDKQRDLIIKQAQIEGLPLEEHSYPSGNKGIILRDKKGHIRAIATNGKQIYEWLYQSVGGNILQSDKEVSLFLLRAGIDGIRYPAESISRGATSDNVRGFNYVVFDENTVTIEEHIRFQQGRQTTGEQNAGLTPNRDVQVYITPATVRNFNEETLRLKELTEEYNNVAKEISQGNLENQEKFTNLQHQILDAYQEHIKEKVSKIRGVNVNFNQPYLGSWQGNYEPSLNMTLSISPNADTGAISGLLFDLAENTSQDAFILEERSEIEDRTPLTEFDEAGMMHYPQIRVNFNNQLSVAEKSIIAQRLKNNGVEEFSIDGDYFIVSIIDFNLETNEQKKKHFAEMATAITAPFRGEGERVGTNTVRDVQSHFRKSRYVGARNEGDEQSQTREYDRSDLFETQPSNTGQQVTGEQDVQISNQESKAFNEGVEEVAKLAKEYKKEFGIDSVQHNKVTKLFSTVSKMIAEAYEQAEAGMTTEEVKEAYEALEKETLQQYKFIVDKGLKVSRWTGEGEPYPNSKSMLKDVRENNHLYFLPNSEAFGKEGDEVEGRAGLKLTDVYLEDGYRMTLSEVFRVVHDYFGHGILGNQFGAIGEENATLQHLDLYSYKALPAVIFQTRGQNSWVNFSGVNDEALRKIKEGSKTNNQNLLKEGQEEFRFATPKDNILPKIFNFKYYETARRIYEQEEIRKSEAYLDPRGTYEDTYISEALSRQTSRNSGKLGGFNRRDLGRTKRVGDYDVKVIAEYQGDSTVENAIKEAFPSFVGVQKIYEISDGKVYRDLMIKALETNKFKSSVTVHSAEDFSKMRLFVTEDGSAGVTLTKEGFLGGGFSNPKANRPNDLSQLLLLGIKEGALTAEAFDTVLPNYYSMFGFKAVSRTAFNDDFRPLKENGALEDWDYNTYKRFNNGRPDVVFFIYDGGDRNTIQDRLRQFDSYSNYQKQFTEYYDKDSYNDAYRFMEVEAINKNNYQNTEDTSRSAQLTVVTDLIGNQTEVDSGSIITYESEAGPIHYIVDSNGDMQMVRLGQQTAPQRVSKQRLDKVTIKGAVTGSNEVFINTDLATQDTPIHEFAHIYNTWLQQNRPELWNKGKSLIEAELNKENSEIKEVIDYVKATQPTLTGDALVDEIMAELVGRRGVELINSKSKGGVVNWIKDVWAEIAKMLGLSQMNPTQVANLTIKEYADAMAIDLLSGRDLKKQKRFIIKPSVTPADTTVNSRNRPATVSTNSLFTQNRSYSRKEAPTITTAYISEYNPFMILKDKIKSVRLLGYDIASNKGRVLVNFADGSPSVEYSNVAFNRKEVNKTTSNSSIPDGVDVDESKSFVVYHFRESFLNEGEEAVKNYFKNLVENENMIKFANENAIYRFSDGQLRSTNGEYLSMDYTRPFSLTKEINSPLSIRKQNTIILSEELRRQSKIEQNRDC